MKKQLISLAVLLAVLINLLPVGTVYAEETNREEVRRELSKGWDKVIYGNLINEHDAALFAIAVAESVATENPGPIFAFFSDQINAQIDKIQRSASDINSRELKTLLTKAFNSKGKILRKGPLEISAGLITYKRWETVIYDEPRTYKCKIKGPFGTWTWGACTTTVRVEKKVPLPNNFQPYIRWRIVK